jgi:hypothetical protein
MPKAKKRKRASSRKRTVKNPLKIGKWIKAKIKKLRNGGYRVEVPGYGLPYGMRPKDR